MTAIDAERARLLLEGTTPGPWEVEDEGGTWLEIHAPNDTNHQFAFEVHCNKNATNDAQLAAAAPDLARAVIALTEERDDLQAERVEGLRIGYALTEDCQTVGEMATALVGLVRKARAERDAAIAERDAARARCDDAGALLEAEVHWHTETKGYRQHAEQQLAAAQARIADSTADRARLLEHIVAVDEDRDRLQSTVIAAQERIAELEAAAGAISRKLGTRIDDGDLLPGAEDETHVCHVYGGVHVTLKEVRALRAALAGGEKG